MKQIKNNDIVYIVENVNINNIKIGDTILDPAGIIRTVCQNNIKRDNFLGLLLFGDSYNLGTKPVQRLKIYNGKYFYTR